MQAVPGSDFGHCPDIPGAVWGDCAGGLCQEMRGGKAGQEDNNSKMDTASVKSNSSAGFKSRAGE